jgi:hypothetical protein
MLIGGATNAGTDATNAMQRMWIGGATNAEWGMRLTRATNAKPSATNAKRGVQRMRIECATNATTPGCNKCERRTLKPSAMNAKRGATNAGSNRCFTRCNECDGVQRMRQRMRQVQRMRLRDERDYGSNGCSIGYARIVPRGAACW